MSTLWTSLALTLAAAGIALAAWALFADRARGRKRCPKCWYEMTGVPSYDREGVAALVCPECGKPVKSERSLFKTRRRWKLAFLSPVLLVGAWLTWKIPEIRRDGWWSVAPRQVLIVLIPEIERAGAQSGRSSRSPLRTQIETRVFRRGWELAGLTWPERWLLGSVCERLILSATTPEFTRTIAARGFVLTREDGIDRIPPERLAPVLLAQSNLTYRRATSYRDRGIVKGDIGERDERPFITAMTRQDQFRFEFLHGFGRELSHRYVIWRNGPRNGPQVKSWWTIRPQIATNPDTSIPLATATGVSGSAASTVPHMLFAETGVSALTFITSAKLLGRELIGDRECFHIAGNGFVGGKGDVWIECERHLILRLDQLGYVTTYTPELNIPIDDSWFEFDAAAPDRSPLQDSTPPAK